MVPQPMSMSAFRPDDSHLDSTVTLEQHLLSGIPPDLALDLVLNEIVVRAAEATGASAAALALTRGDEMVCRAATGHLAPELGVPLKARDGLSGACLQTRQPQLSVDTEFDPRVDPTVSRRLGIRSILVVPVFEMNNDSQFAGVLEVFSTSPAAFSDSDQKLLEGFAEECARVRYAAVELSQRKPLPAILAPEFVAPKFITASTVPARRSRYETWTLGLAASTILATVAVSFLIGSRVGWLHNPASRTQITQPVSAETSAASVPGEPSRTTPAAAHQAKRSSSERTPKQTLPTPTTPPAGDDLVVYDKGKVIFRIKSAPNKPDQANLDSTPSNSKQDNDPVVQAASTTKIAAFKSVWLPPAQAETRIVSRTEPEYPAEALAARRAGDVVLKVQVAEDGSVSTIRTLRGDPLLAAAAVEAVRSWRYQPYRYHGHPAQFQTDVTLSFILSD
jgi:TonB family protein